MLLTTVLLALSFQPAHIVFVRHSETIANATGRYNSTTLNAFSKRGLAQTVKLTNQLENSDFDAVLVSPSPRALKTVAPFLQRSFLTAEIWPELYECCHQKGSAKLKPRSPYVRYGGQIQWPDAFDGLFSVRPGGERYIDSSTYSDGIRQIYLAYNKVLDEFSGTGKRILIVGHSIQGGKMLYLLTGGKKIEIPNAKPIHLIEVSPGRFAIS